MEKMPFHSTNSERATTTMIRTNELLTNEQVLANTVTTVTTSEGTITDFGPERIVLHSETVKEPLTYTYSKTTTYVDEDGNPAFVFRRPSSALRRHYQLLNRVRSA